MLIYLAIVLGVVALLAGVILAYFGLRPLRVRTAQPYSSELRVAYRFAVGRYKDCGPLFMESEKLTSPGPCPAMVGVYYDDPDVAKPDRCRYIVGVVLEGSRAEEHEKKLLSHGYSVFTFPCIDNALIIDHPAKYLFLILIGVWRIYPKLKSFVKENGIDMKGPIMELYQNNQMRVIAPLHKEDAFFVPEVQVEK